MANASPHEAYLAKLAPAPRAALTKLRAALRAALPRAEEVMSYGMPAFRQDGVLVAGFAASAKHCAYYPMSGAVVAAMGDALAGYKTSKGAVQFDPAKPLPATLVRELVAARLAEAGMAAKTKKVAKKAGPKANPGAAELVTALQRAGSAKFKADMSARYGIVTRDITFGTPMAKIKAIAKPLGKDHTLALALWDEGVYEARILTSMVGDPAELTGAQMDRWCKQFDNWGVCDTLCFNLFDRSPLAFAKVDAWAKRKPEFEKRAAFALLACLALHRRGEDKDYVKRLPLIEAAASDERNFVKKGVSWALRGVGKRVRAPALALAKKLAASEDATERWVGKDALRDLLR